jgi:hypothetical protein
MAAHLQNNVPHAQPQPAEFSEMAQRAAQVVRLLEELRRMTHPDADRLKMDALSAADDHRPPKRPWEDLSQEGAEGGADVCCHSQRIE